MDFDDTTEEAAFRAEVRAFLDANAERKRDNRASIDAQTVDLARSRAWQAKKADAGFAAIRLPKRYGGRDGTPIQQIIYNHEEAKYYLPPGRLFMVTLGMCIPTMIAYAKPEQLDRYVKPAVRGEEIWCQLFSEPSGGSDLAGLRTRAIRDADEWVVNGQKIWTSGAHISDFGLLLARTDPEVPKHAGLTAFFLDMKSPGVEVRPIRQISGRSHFNEVFFTDVRVPDSQRLGAIGEGWKVALHTLMNERLTVGTTTEGPDLTDIFALAHTIELDGVPAIRHPAVRERLADWFVRMEGIKYAGFRVMTALSHGRTPGPEASIIKVVACQTLMASSSFVLDLLGMAGAVSDPQLAPMKGWFQRNYLHAPGERIGGGTEEIMLNIIAERVLGLPGDIRADKDVPFNKIKVGKFGKREE